MRNSINVKFIFDFACLGLFSSANNPQIADVALKSSCLLAFLAMFLAIISPNFYSWNDKMSSIFVFTTKTTQPHPQVLLVMVP